MSKLLLVVALLALLVGCSTKIKPDPSKPAEVKLVEAGSGEKSPLRFKPVAGTTEDMRLTMRMGVKLAGQQVDIPPVTVTFSMTTKDVESDGSFTYDYTLKHAALEGGDPRMAAALGKIRELEGLSGTARLSGRGVVLSSKANTPRGAGPETRDILDSLNQSFGQMMAPLPEEAVGVGAKWDVTQGVESKGIVLLQTAHYELASRTGDKIGLKVTLSQSADAQEMEVQGAKVELESMNTNGSGDIQLDLTKLVPERSTLGLDMKMKAKAKGQSQEVEMHIGLTVD